MKTLTEEEGSKQTHFLNKYLGTEKDQLIIDEEEGEEVTEDEDPLHLYASENDENGNNETKSRKKSENFGSSILDNLTPCDVRVLVNTEVKDLKRCPGLAGHIFYSKAINISYHNILKFIFK